MLRRAVAHGTTPVRTPVDVDPAVGLTGIDGGWGGRTTIGHVTTLCGYDADRRRRLIDELAGAGVGVVVLDAVGADHHTALLDRVPRRYVISGGRVVAQTRTDTELHVP